MKSNGKQSNYLKKTRQYQPCFRVGLPVGDADADLARAGDGDEDAGEAFGAWFGAWFGAGGRHGSGGVEGGVMEGITAMRAHGFTFDRGGRTTVQLAHAWLAQNPQFQGPATKN